MAGRILVTFASRYGSTEEVACTVADELLGGGLEIEVRPLQEVRDLAPYRGAVVGAPLYFGALPKEALAFLTRHGAALRNLPVALFALGPLQPGERELREAQAALEAQLARLPAFKPLAHTVFGGKFDPTRLSLGHRLLAALPASPLHGLPASDTRDWNAIRTWAAALVPLLRPAHQTEVVR